MLLRAQWCAVALLFAASQVVGQPAGKFVSLDAAVQAAWARHPSLRFSEAVRESSEWLAADGERVLGGTPTIASRFNSDRMIDNVGEEEWEVILNLPLMPPGEADARKRFGQQGLALAQYTEQAYRLQVAGEVRQLSAELHSAQLDRALQSERVDAARALLELLEALVRSGARPQSDVLQVRAALLASDNALLDAEQEVEHCISRWHALTGLVALPERTSESQTDVTHDALLNQHPALQWAEAQLANARAKVDLEQARWVSKPVVGFGYRGQQANRQGPSIESLGVYFELPLDFGGFNRSAQSSAYQAQAQAEMKLSMLQRRVGQDLHDAQLAIDSARRALVLAEEREANARELLDSATLQFEVDRLSVLEFLTMRSRYWEARSVLATKQLEAELAVSHFNQAAGVMPQ